MLDQFTIALENGIEDLAIGLYTEDIHGSEQKAWTEILKKNIVVISSQVI